MVETTAVSTSGGAAQALALSGLPLPCIKRVFAYACDCAPPASSAHRTLNLAQHDADLPPPRQLQRLALVSRRWHVFADSILRERQAFSLQLTLCVDRNGSTNAGALAHELQTRARSLRDLRLALVSTDASSTSTGGGDDSGSQEQQLQQIEAADVDWDALLCHCSALWRLDLTCVPLYSKHLAKILDTAGAHCAELQSLVLPDKQPSDAAAAPPQLHQTFASLYRALQCWHAQSGGLRQLTVPRRCEEPADAFPHYTDEYLFALAAFCPNLELFDGWKVTYEEGEFIECEEMLFCHRAAWSRFCACCTALQEFNWFIAPFAGEFFQTFAAHSKPMLAKLTLAGDPPDKWSDMLVDGDYYDGESFAFTKDDVALVLAACPALRELAIRLYNSVNELVTQELFDDAFLLTLARACPHLETFSFNELESGQPVCESSVITDVGLEALARLPDLADVYLKQTSCTGAGVFAFVECMRRPQRFRRVQVVVGNGDRDDFARFYKLLTELLARLGAHPDGQFRTHRFELRVVRQCAAHDSVARGGSALALQFARAVQSLRAAYEHLFHLRIGADGWDAQFADRSTEELETTLGAARVFVLASKC